MPKSFGQRPSTVTLFSSKDCLTISENILWEGGAMQKLYPMLPLKVLLDETTAMFTNLRGIQSPGFRPLWPLLVS